MNNLLYVNANAFSLLILLVISFSFRRRPRRSVPEQGFFPALAAIDAVELVLDSAGRLLNGVPGAVARAVGAATAALGCIFVVSACYLWCLYVFCRVSHSEGSVGRAALLLLPPLLAGCAVAVLSIPFGFAFTIDGANSYHRGPAFLFFAAVCYFYLACSAVFLLRRRKKLNRKECLPPVLFTVLPAAGGLLQVLFYGVPLIWNCIAAALLIAFVSFQNRELSTDYLTGLYNRRQLDRLLQQRLRPGAQGGLLGGVMLDIDSFKQINDTFGHGAGDRALAEAAKILRRSFRSGDLLCRYGGDEFVVLLDIKRESDLSAAVGRLRQNLEAHNRSRPPFPLDFSIGSGICQTGSSVDGQQFLKQIDMLMYADKLQHKTAAAVRS